MYADPFETPATVMAKVLYRYETVSRSSIHNSHGDNVNPEPKDVASRAGAAFAKFFKVLPRPFGQKTDDASGFSDNNDGVQWNIALYLPGKAVLGVNPEGMKYKDWPMADLLVRESGKAKFHPPGEVENAGQITVWMFRDAWQASARPPTEERQTGSSGKSLSELSKSEWEDRVNEGLGCLNSSVNFKGRKKQIVTLMASGKKVEKQVAPHLWITARLWSELPSSVHHAIELIDKACQRLLPVCGFVEERCVAVAD